MFENIFKEYVKHFDLNNFDIRHKYNHSMRVAMLNEKYAKLLDYSEEDIRLAKFIGMYHDIGRFNQLTKYQTYEDVISFDHAKEGIRVLFDEHLINQIDLTDEEKSIAKYAIYYHNKLKLDEVEEARKVKHAKLIRDTDKLDIIYLKSILGNEHNKPINEPLDERIIECFKKKQILPYMDVINHEICRTFAFAFDINNDICVGRFKEYLKKFYESLEDNKEVFKGIYDEVMSYLEKKEGNIDVRNKIRSLKC